MAHCETSPPEPTEIVDPLNRSAPEPDTVNDPLLTALSVRVEVVMFWANEDIPDSVENVKELIEANGPDSVEKVNELIEASAPVRVEKDTESMKLDAPLRVENEMLPA